MQVPPRGLLFLISAVLASATAAQGKLWIVDQAGGLGSDFLDIQSAVDAAVDGDSILVRQGQAYPDFVIDGKSLTVLVETGAQAWMEMASVRNLAPHQDATLRGIGPKQLRVEGCLGAVMLEDIGDPAGGPFFVPCFGFGGGRTDAVRILGSDAVVMSRCNVNGPGSTLATPAILIQDSSAHLYNVGATGGEYPTLKGGNGVEVKGNSFLFASGCYFVGGCGGDSDEPCFSGPGAGGNGLVASPSTAYLLDVGLWGGMGGFFSCPPWFSAPDGLPAIGGYSLVSGYARGYEISASVSGGTAAEIHYTGQPGDLALGLVSLDAAPLSMLELAGTLVVAIPPILVVHGSVSATGELIIMAATPVLPAGLEALPVYVQGAAISAVGAAVLGAPSVMTIL